VLRIQRLRIAGIGKFAAGGNHRVWETLDANDPERDIHFMHALIAQQAQGGLPGACSFGKRTAHARLHIIPVAIAEVADDRQLCAMNGQYIRTKVRLRPKPSGLPILKWVIGGCHGLGRPRCENPHQGVRTFRQIGGAGDHDCGAHFRLNSAFENTNHDVARFQSIPSDSLTSSRRTEAARNLAIRGYPAPVSALSRRETEKWNSALGLTGSVRAKGDGQASYGADGSPGFRSAAFAQNP
jgi:hypothetical protein